MNAFDVAQYILIEESKKNRLVSNIRLQKYLYFSQFISFSVYGFELFNDDFEAWEYGPCIPKIYTRFKAYGSTGIIVLGDGDSKYIPDILGYRYDYDKPNEHDRFVINKAIEFCDRFTNDELVDICHSHKCWDLAFKGAYIKARKLSNGNLVYLIPKESIEKEVNSLDESGLIWYNIKEPEKRCFASSSPNGAEPKTKSKKKCRKASKKKTNKNLVDRLRKV